MNVLVVLNGELYKPEIIRSRIQPEKFDLVLAADGGAHKAEILGVQPDAIIGDMDSFPEAESAVAKAPELVRFPPEKDEIDLELALLHAVEKGATRIVMVAATGGRIDMTLANIMLLTHANFRSHKIELWHGDQTCRLIQPPGDAYPGKPGDTVSILPLGGDASGIYLTGMKYPLVNALLTTGMPRGISNVIEMLPAKVAFKKGLLLMVHTPAESDELR